jgi:HK97 family phage prohead protease
MDKITILGRIEAADTPGRTITGRIVTWGEIGHTSRGATRFAPDSITASNTVKLLLEHDSTRPIGRAIQLSEVPEGLNASFRIINTQSGTDALTEASEGLRGGLSVGAIIHDSHIDHEGTLVVTSAELDEVSLVVNPALATARVFDVAASHNEESENNEMSTETITEEIEVPEDNETVEETVTASNLAPVRSAPRPVEFTSPADYINAYVAASRGDRNAARRIEAANQTTTDNPGIVPTPIIGNVITFLNSKRPVVSASRSIGLPGSGASFVRPYVSTHTSVGKQAKEFDPLASQTMKVIPISVAKATYGGSLSISFQDRDWTEPEILNLVVTDMSAQYAVQTDGAACLELTTSVKATQALAADADAKATVAAIAGASAQIGAKVFEMPDTLYVSFDKWAFLASLCDTTGRPAFPYVGAMNSAGTNAGGVRSMDMNVMGLRVVADANLPAGTMIVGRSDLLETYETVGGQVSVVSPSTLSFSLAYYGYFATKVVEPNGFVVLKPSA